MKSRTFIILLLVIGSKIGLCAQDFIVLKTGTEIKAKIIELSPTEIRYKAFDNLNGPTIVLDKNTVFMMRYENGKTELVNPIIEQPKTAHISTPSVETTQKVNSMPSTVQTTLGTKQIVHNIPEKSFIGGIYIGSSMPLFSYASTNFEDNEKAAGAKIGFCGGVQLGYKVNKNMSILLDGQFNNNPYKIELEDVRNIYTLRGNWQQIHILPSIRYDKFISDKSSTYMMASAGVSFASIKGDFGDVLDVIDTKTQATSIVLSYESGWILQKYLKLGVRIIYSNPRFGEYKQDILNSQIIMGIQF